MKITVVTWYFPTRHEPYRGHSAYRTLLELQKIVDVHVVCPQPVYPRAFGPKSYLHPEPETQLPGCEISVKFVPYRVVPVLSRPINGFLCAKAIEREVRASSPDLLLAYKAFPDGFAAVQLAKKLGIPSAVVCIGSDLNRIPELFTRWMMRMTMKQADLVFTVSKHLRQQAIRLGASPEKVHATHNGCNCDIFHPASRDEARRMLGVEPDAKLVLFVGRLDQAKGVLELVRAFQQVRQNIRTARLVMVGEGPARPMLEQTIRGADLAQDCVFIPPCSSIEVARWMAACDVFSLPSYAEGCPNVVLEALHCGRPVVGTAVGGIPELVTEKNGILVSPREHLPLAHALEEALSRVWDPQKIYADARREWFDVAREKLEICSRLVDPCKQQLTVASSV